MMHIYSPAHFFPRCSAMKDFLLDKCVVPGRGACYVSGSALSIEKT